jgi:hypothetical protein
LEKNAGLILNTKTASRSSENMTMFKYMDRSKKLEFDSCENSDQFGNIVRPALNGPFIERKFVLNGNTFRSRDFRTEKNVKYLGLNGNSLTRKRKSK